jgi:RNA polymerase sigma factor (sigma-70 family)
MVAGRDWPGFEASRMPPERDATDSQLFEMSPDGLFFEFIRLRESGRVERAGLCMQLFAYRMSEELRVHALQRLPSEAVEDVVSATLESVVRSTGDGKVPFDGHAIEQLYKWMYTLLQRRIAEFYRRRDAQSRKAVEVSLDASDEAEAGLAGLLGENDAGYLAIELEEIRNRLIGSLRSDHRQVMSMTYDGYRPDEIAQVTGLSVSNIHQIKSRFSKARDAAYREAGFLETSQDSVVDSDGSLGDAA